jgi:hypothetical protein
MKRDDYDPWKQEVRPTAEDVAILPRWMPDFTRLSPDKVMRDAGRSLEDYLHNARIMLDREFGVGTAQRMPEVLAALVSAQATEVASASVAGAVQWLAHDLHAALDPAACLQDEQEGD